MEEPNEIPEEFYSFSTGKPFEKCSDCERDLLTGNVKYSISKIIRQYADYTAKDVIVEFAICLDCATTMSKKISEDSRLVIFAYQLNLQLCSEPTYEEAMSKCVFSKKPKETLENHQIIAFCKGSQLSTDSDPYLIDNAEFEELDDELSDATKDVFDDFYQNLIGPTPEWIKENMPGGKLVLV